MVTRMRTDLSAEDVPVIAGELGTFLQDHDGCESFAVVNQQLRELERSLTVYGCVTSKGLTDNGDKVHFNSESLREFGRRYATKYMDLVQIASRSEREAQASAGHRVAGWCRESLAGGHGVGPETMAY